MIASWFGGVRKHVERIVGFFADPEIDVVSLETEAGYPLAAQLRRSAAGVPYVVLVAKASQMTIHQRLSLEEARSLESVLHGMVEKASSVSFSTRD